MLIMSIDVYLDMYNECKEWIRTSNVSDKMKDMLYNSLQKDLQNIGSEEWRKSFEDGIEQCFYYLELTK